MPDDAHKGLWTLSQRRGLIVVVGALLVYLSIRLALNPVTIPDPRPPHAPAVNQLAGRIDPNTATEAELAAIPTLGEKRAGAIVKYRQDYVAAHPGHLAYARLEDLRIISGIGPATLETLQPYLNFSDDSH